MRRRIYLLLTIFSLIILFVGGVSLYPNRNISNKFSTPGSAIVKDGERCGFALTYKANNQCSNNANCTYVHYEDDYGVCINKSAEMPRGVVDVSPPEIKIDTKLSSLCFPKGQGYLYLNVKDDFDFPDDLRYRIMYVNGEDDSIGEFSNYNLRNSKNWSDWLPFEERIELDDTLRLEEVYYVIVQVQDREGNPSDLAIHNIVMFDESWQDDPNCWR